MLWKTTALIVTLAIAPNAAAQVVTPPAVPANLEVPDGNIPYLMPGSPLLSAYPPLEPIS
jgi:hypothetical protein